MATSPVGQTYGSNAAGDAGSSQAAQKSDPLASKTVFLKLLVEEVKNQDPMNPADSTQWVTQMAQYSQLEQMVDINKQVTSMSEAGQSALEQITELNKQLKSIYELLQPPADSGNTGESTQETN